MLVHPAKQADKYVIPSDPHTGVKESVWHLQLLLQAEYGAKLEAGADLKGKKGKGEQLGLEGRGPTSRVPSRKLFALITSFALITRHHKEQKELWAWTEIDGRGLGGEPYEQWK